MVIAESEVEVRGHADIISRMDTFFQAEKQRYARMRRPIGAGCHELHPNAYATEIGGERVVDRGLASYQIVEGADSVYFQGKNRRPDWHEIALKESSGTGKDLVVDFVLSDDRFRPDVYKTKSGKIFTFSDFEQNPPSDELEQELHQAEQLPPLFDGFIMIEDQGRSYNDADQYTEGVNRPKFIDYPVNPSLPTIFYGGTWSLKGRRYGGDYFDNGLDRFSEE